MPHLIFTYRRTVESVAYGPAVEYGSNLTGWTTADDRVNSGLISVASNGFGPGIDSMQVKIPAHDVGHHVS